MDIEKKQRGRPHKLEEDKLIGRRISMVQARWDTIDAFLLTDGAKLNELFHGVSEALGIIMRSEEGEQCESGL